MQLNVRRIKIALLDKGYSIQQLAKEMKVHPSTVSAWFISPARPQLEDVSKMAAILGLPTSEIITNENETVGSRLHEVRAE